MSTAFAAPHEKGATIYDYVIPARAPWSGIVRRGQTLRLIDLEGNQAVDCILYNAADPTERYSAAQTIVAQANVFLTTGTRLMSDEGNVLMTIAPTPAAATTPSPALAVANPTPCATAITPNTSTPASRISCWRWADIPWASATWSATSTGS